MITSSKAWSGAGPIRDKLLQSRSWDGAFLAHLAFRVRFLETTDIQTAGTDGLDIWFNDAFMAGHSASEQITVVAHELLHIALGHCVPGKGPTLLENIAQDLAINAILRSKRLALVPGMLLPGVGDYADMPDLLDWQDYYRRLSQRQQAQGQPQGKDKGQPSNAGTGAGQGLQPQAWGERLPAQTTGDAQVDNSIQAAKRIAAAAQAATAQIGQPGSGSALAGKVQAVPVEPPQGAFDLLRAVLAARSSRQVSPIKCSNVGYGCGEWIYSTVSNPGQALILVDTSGSIFSRLPQFLGECLAIAQEFQVRLDIRFHTDTLAAEGLILDPSDDLPEIDAETGGTSHIEPLAKLQAEAEAGASWDACLMLTDGATHWPTVAPEIGCAIVVGLTEPHYADQIPSWVDAHGPITL